MLCNNNQSNKYLIRIILDIIYKIYIPFVNIAKRLFIENDHVFCCFTSESRHSMGEAKEKIKNGQKKGEGEMRNEKIRGKMRNEEWERKKEKWEMRKEKRGGKWENENMI